MVRNTHDPGLKKFLTESTPKKISDSLKSMTKVYYLNEKVALSPIFLFVQIWGSGASILSKLHALTNSRFRPNLVNSPLVLAQQGYYGEEFHLPVHHV